MAELEGLISYWEGVLTQYRFVMGVTTQVLIEPTIRYLKKIKEGVSMKHPAYKKPLEQKKQVPIKLEGKPEGKEAESVGLEKKPEEKKPEQRLDAIIKEKIKEVDKLLDRLNAQVEDIIYSKGFYAGCRYVVGTAEDIMVKNFGLKSRAELATSDELPSFWIGTLIACLDDPPGVIHFPGREKKKRREESEDEQDGVGES